MVPISRTATVAVDTRETTTHSYPSKNCCVVWEKYRGPKHMRSSVEHGKGRGDGALDHPTRSDYDNNPTPKRKRGGDKGGNTDSRSSVHLFSYGSTPEEQSVEQGSCSTPPTSVPGSEARYEPWKCLPGDPNADRRRQSIYSPPHGNIQSSISDAPPPTPPHHPPPSGTLLSSTSESSDSALKDIEPHHSRERKEKGDKEMGTKEMGTKEMGTKEMGTKRMAEKIKRLGRPWAPQAFEILPSGQQTMQA